MNIKGSRSNEINWRDIRNEYLTGTISLRELAKKYNVSASAICMRSKREKWVNSVQAIDSEVSEKVREQIVNAKVSNNERALNCTNELLKLIESSISNCKEKDVGAIKSLVASLKDLNDLGVFQLMEEDRDIKVEFSDELDDYAD